MAGLASRLLRTQPLTESPAEGWAGSTVASGYGVAVADDGGAWFRAALADALLQAGLLRGDAWTFGPEAPYERQGDVGNVTFPYGYTIDADGDTINLYYGAADTSVALATGSVRELLHWLDEHGS
jgi:hypothetical protein